MQSEERCQAFVRQSSFKQFFWKLKKYIDLNVHNHELFDTSNIAMKEEVICFQFGKFYISTNIDDLNEKKK